MFSELIGTHYIAVVPLCCLNVVRNFAAKLTSNWYAIDKFIKYCNKWCGHHCNWVLQFDHGIIILTVRYPLEHMSWQSLGHQH